MPPKCRAIILNVALITPQTHGVFIKSNNSNVTHKNIEWIRHHFRFRINCAVDCRIHAAYAVYSNSNDQNCTFSDHRRVCVWWW